MTEPAAVARGSSFGETRRPAHKRDPNCAPGKRHPNCNPTRRPSMTALVAQVTRGDLRFGRETAEILLGCAIPCSAGHDSGAPLCRARWRNCCAPIRDRSWPPWPRDPVGTRFAALADYRCVPPADASYNTAEYFTWPHTAQLARPTLGPQAAAGRADRMQRAWQRLLGAHFPPQTLDFTPTAVWTCCLAASGPGYNRSRRREGACWPRAIADNAAGLSAPLCASRTAQCRLLPARRAPLRRRWWCSTTRAAIR